MDEHDGINIMDEHDGINIMDEHDEINIMDEHDEINIMDEHDEINIMDEHDEINIMDEHDEINIMDELDEIYILDEHDEINILEELIKAGANVNAQNNCMQTPLHVAASHHNWEAIDTLIAYDAEINIKDICGDTALHLTVDQLWSSRQNERETGSRIVKKLLHSGADPNISNAEGEFPLMVAAKYGNLDAVKDLLEFGANVHFRNIYLETCLHLLFQYSEPDDIAILHELVMHGACINCCDDNGQTALDVFLELTDKVGFGRKLIKALIKISTLVNWKHKIVFQVTDQNREQILSLEGFMDECYKEVSRMKSYIYSNGSTLCHFAINGEKITQKVRSEISIMDEVLNTLINDEFPIYDDLIEVHFDETFLKEKLFEMNVYSRNIKGEVRLHPDVISDIASYLSGRDLLNLARACAQPSKDSLRNGKVD